MKSVCIYGGVDKKEQVQANPNPTPTPTPTRTPTPTPTPTLTPTPTPNPDPDPNPNPNQVQALRRAPEVVVATPGRLGDMLQRKKTVLTHAEPCGYA